MGGLLNKRSPSGLKDPVWRAPQSPGIAHQGLIFGDLGSLGALFASHVNARNDDCSLRSGPRGGLQGGWQKTP